MRFFECNLSYKSKDDSRISEIISTMPKKNWGDVLIQDMNETLAEKVGKEKIEIMICSAKVGKFNLIVATELLEKITAENLSKIFVKRLSEFEIISAKILSLNEITPAIAAKLLRQAERNDYTTYRCNWEREGFGDNEDFSLNYYRNGSFNENFRKESSDFSRERNCDIDF